MIKWDRVAHQWENYGVSIRTPQKSVFRTENNKTNTHLTHLQKKINLRQTVNLNVGGKAIMPLQTFIGSYFNNLGLKENLLRPQKEKYQ